jgi:hypothetical protein
METNKTENIDPSVHIQMVHSAIAILAEINAIGETQLLTEKQMEDRRLIIDALYKIKAIELEEPKESGKFAFTSAEEQDIYLRIYEATKTNR